MTEQLYPGLLSWTWLLPCWSHGARLILPSLYTLPELLRGLLGSCALAKVPYKPTGDWLWLQAINLLLLHLRILQRKIFTFSLTSAPEILRFQTLPLSLPFLVPCSSQRKTCRLDLATSQEGRLGASLLPNWPIIAKWSQSSYTPFLFQDWR